MSDPRIKVIMRPTSPEDFSGMPISTNTIKIPTTPRPAPVRSKSVAKFKVEGVNGRFSSKGQATVAINRGTGVVSVRLKGSRTEHLMTLTAVAEWIIAKNEMANVKQKQKLRR